MPEEHDRPDNDDIERREEVRGQEQESDEFDDDEMDELEDDDDELVEER